MSFCLQVAGDGDVFPMLAIYAPYVRDTAITFEYKVPTAAEFGARLHQPGDVGPRRGLLGRQSLDAVAQFGGPQRDQGLNCCYGHLGLASLFFSRGFSLR